MGSTPLEDGCFPVDSDDDVEGSLWQRVGGRSGNSEAEVFGGVCSFFQVECIGLEKKSGLKKGVVF